MRLEKFGIQNFRSIIHAEHLELSNYSVLIGPNNEGKSNILKGLSLGLKLLSIPRNSRLLHRQLVLRPNFGAYDDDRYSWERDFPISLQNDPKKRKSTFSFYFVLTDLERKEFAKEVGSSIDGTLHIELSLDKIKSEFSVRKKGLGHKSLSNKRTLIEQFIQKRLFFTDIPAIRTPESTINSVANIISRELSILSSEDSEYSELIKKIKEKQMPIINKIKDNSFTYLKQYLPHIKSLDINYINRYMFDTISDLDITIDDGTKTSLFYKGDGIQNLACIAFIQQAVELKKQSKEMILAIEEPEVHLHSGAIHQLTKTLKELSKTQQVIITTHSPILINRDNISSNIIVKKQKALPAKDISDIRTILGIQIPDNLSSAKLVLLVEGDIDREIIKTILKSSSTKLTDALKNGYMAIESLDSVKNLEFRIKVYRDILVPKLFILLDGDSPAKAEISKLQNKSVLSTKEYSVLTSATKKQIELEDIYDPKIYLDQLNSKYGVVINLDEFNSVDKKWSEKMKLFFEKNGKVWTDSTKSELKHFIKDLVLIDINKGILKEHMQFMANLVAQFEENLYE